MIAGTFIEKCCGADYAASIVYQSEWFHLILIIMSLNLLSTILTRFSLKQKFIGLYAIHVSLILFILAAFITKNYGLKGEIKLSPKNATTSVLMEKEEVFVVTEGHNAYLYQLPRASFEKELNESLRIDNNHVIKVSKYIPFARKISVLKERPNSWNSIWSLERGKEKQILKLTNRSSSDFQSQVDFKSVGIRVVGTDIFKALKEGLEKFNTSILIFDIQNGEWVFIKRNKNNTSFAKLGNKEIILKNMKSSVDEDVELFGLRVSGRKYFYIPSIYGHPLDDKFHKTNAPYLLYDLKAIFESDLVFITKNENNQIHLGIKEEKGWTFFKYNFEKVRVPFTDLILFLERDLNAYIPEDTFESIIPSKKGEEVYKAILLEYKFNGEKLKKWVSNSSPAVFEVGNFRFRAVISKREVNLPFALTLDHFNLVKDEKLDVPVDYESFLRVGSVEKLRHVSMNNPLNIGDYSFYQSSYYKNNLGSFNSILLVNKDPGRPLKYIASFLLLIGLMMQYLKLGRRSK